MRRGSERGSIRGPATTTNRRSSTRRRAAGIGVDDPAQQVLADAGSADGDDAHPLVGAVAELGAQRLAVGELGRVEAGDVAGELEVRLGPLADRRQVGPERVGHDVVGIADEDRAVAEAPVAGALLDHLGVVVGGQRRLVRRRRRASAASRRSRSSRRTRSASARGSRAGSSRRPTPRRRSRGRSARP